MRILVSVSPRMYREAIATSLRQHRPGLEVRIVPPEKTEQQVKVFGPHLLVHNDTAGLERAVLEGVRSWVEVCYSDSMDAWICADGHLEESKDICTATLLRVVDETAALEEAIDEWALSELRRVQAAHSAIILASEDGLSLSRATPMPHS